MIIDVTAENFDSEVLNSNKPVLVEFGATWCQPCKMMKPVLDKFSEKYSEKMSVVKIDIDDNSELGSNYSVTSVPTFLVFSEGSVVKTFTGAKPEPALVKELSEFL